MSCSAILPSKRRCAFRSIYYSIFIFLFSLFLFSSCQCKEDVRLMSYNVRNGIGMDGRRDLHRVAEVINAVAPDVVALQELDSMTARSGNRDILAELAALTGMTPVYAPAIDFDGGRYGIGILTRTPPSAIVRRSLPGREEERALVAVEFPGYVFACTHLSLTEADRMLSVSVINDVASQVVGKPFFLAGDFNAEPAEPFIRVISDRYDILTDTTVRTFPADEPEITIDYIVQLKKQNAESGSGQCKHKDNSSFVIPGSEVASDHRPVCIDVKIPKKK